MTPRAVALLALALPVCAGLLYLALFGAPTSYMIINAGALALAGGWIAFGLTPTTIKTRRVAAVLLLAMLFAPLAIGPEYNEVSRWLPLGPFTLHSGALVLPALTVLSARDEDYAAPILLTALLAALLQPDAATAFAVMVAAVGLYFAWRTWPPGIVAIAGFVAGVLAAVRGELPARPFVEHVLAELVLDAPLMALGLFLALFASFFLMLRALHATAAVRFTLAGSLAGFSITALLSNYPSVLVGYGAAPILGYALALRLSEPTESKAAEKAPGSTG